MVHTQYLETELFLFLKLSRLPDSSNKTGERKIITNMSNLLKNFPLQRQDTVQRIGQRLRSDDELEGLASMGYHERLTTFARDATRRTVDGSTTIIDFRPLYAVTIHHLQRLLSVEMQAFSTQNMTDVQLETIRKLLKQYSNLPPLSNPRLSWIGAVDS